MASAGPICDRCEETSADFECSNCCAGAEAFYLCESCHKIIHVGKLKSHVVVSIEAQCKEKIQESLDKLAVRNSLLDEQLTRVEQNQAALDDCIKTSKATYDNQYDNLVAFFLSKKDETWSELEACLQPHMERLASAKLRLETEKTSLEQKIAGGQALQSSITGSCASFLEEVDLMCADEIDDRDLTPAISVACPGLMNSYIMGSMQLPQPCVNGHLAPGTVLPEIRASERCFMNSHFLFHRMSSEQLEFSTGLSEDIRRACENVPPPAPQSILPNMMYAVRNESGWFRGFMEQAPMKKGGDIRHLNVNVFLVDRSTSCSCRPTDLRPLPANLASRPLVHNYRGALPLQNGLGTREFRWAYTDVMAGARHLKAQVKHVYRSELFPCHWVHVIDLVIVDKQGRTLNVADDIAKRLAQEAQIYQQPTPQAPQQPSISSTAKPFVPKASIVTPPQAAQPAVPHDPPFSALATSSASGQQSTVGAGASCHTHTGHGQLPSKPVNSSVSSGESRLSGAYEDVKGEHCTVAEPSSLPRTHAPVGLANNQYSSPDPVTAGTGDYRAAAEPSSRSASVLTVKAEQQSGLEPIMSSYEGTDGRTSHTQSAVTSRATSPTMSTTNSSCTEVSGGNTVLANKESPCARASVGDCAVPVEVTPSVCASVIRGEEVADVAAANDEQCSVTSVDTDALVDASLQKGALLQVTVPNGISPRGVFWSLLSDPDESDDFHDMMERINGDAVPQQAVMDIDMITEGIYCLARYSVDMRLYRGLVENVDLPQEEVLVRFLDYGNSEVVPFSMVLDLPSEAFGVPFFSFECSLDDVTAEELNEQQIEKFEEAVADVDVTVTVVSENDFHYKVKLTKVVQNDDGTESTTDIGAAVESTEDLASPFVLPTGSWADAVGTPPSTPSARSSVVEETGNCTRVSLNGEAGVVQANSVARTGGQASAPGTSCGGNHAFSYQDKGDARANGVDASQAPQSVGGGREWTGPHAGQPVTILRPPNQYTPPQGVGRLAAAAFSGLPIAPMQAQQTGGHGPNQREHESSGRKKNKKKRHQHSNGSNGGSSSSQHYPPNHSAQQAMHPRSA